MFSQLDFFPKSFPGLTLVLSCHKTFDSQTSQALGLGSIPIARSIKPVDAVGFTGFHSRNWRIKYAVLDAVGRGLCQGQPNWTRCFQVLLCTFGWFRGPALHRSLAPIHSFTRRLPRRWTVAGADLN